MYNPKPQTSNTDIKEEQHLLERIKDIDNITKEEKYRILRFIRQMSATYISEISWETTYSEYHVKNILNILHRDNLIEVIKVDENRPDIRLMARVADQSSIGQGGVVNFSRKRWFAITKKGISYINQEGVL